MGVGYCGVVGGTAGWELGDGRVGMGGPWCVWGHCGVESISSRASGGHRALQTPDCRIFASRHRLDLYCSGHLVCGDL